MEISRSGQVLPSSFTYPTLIYLPVTLFILSGMRNRNSFPSLTGSGILIPAMYNFFNKNKSIFNPEHNALMHYPANAKSMMIKKRGRECEIWKEKRENYNK